MEKDNNNMKRQMIYYFSFAGLMILLNYIIQKLNQIWIAPMVCESWGDIDLVQVLYCSTNPFNMAELVGSIAAVGITYVIKFFLDKFIVFQKKSLEIKEASQQFVKYFLFALVTTAENIGIQFIFTNFIGTPLEISFIIALSIGYITKFFLDKKYVFIDKEKVDTE